MRFDQLFRFIGRSQQDRRQMADPSMGESATSESPSQMYTCNPGVAASSEGYSAYYLEPPPFGDGLWSLPQSPLETLTGGITFDNFLRDFHTGVTGLGNATPHHETEAFYPQQSLPVNNTGLHHQASTSVHHSHAVLNNVNPIPVSRGDDLVHVYGGLQRPEGGQCDPSHKQDPEAMPISLTGFMEEHALLNKCKKQLKKKVATPRVLEASLSRRKEKGLPGKYKCHLEGCGSDFTRKFNLDSHLRSHEGVAKYQCPKCKRWLMSSKKRHMDKCQVPLRIDPN